MILPLPCYCTWAEMLLQALRANLMSAFGVGLGWHATLTYRGRCVQVIGTDDLHNVDKVVRRHFSVDEAKEAREVFLAGSSLPVMPVVSWDDVSIGDGMPGRGVLSLKALLLRHMNPANNKGQHVEVPYGYLSGME